MIGNCEKYIVSLKILFDLIFPSFSSESIRIILISTTQQPALLHVNLISTMKQSTFPRLCASSTGRMVLASQIIH